MSAPSAGTNAAQAPVWWALSPADCARRLGTDLERGLSESEARARLESRGRNELPERGGPAAWELLRRQFASLVIWVLVAAGAVSAALGHRLDASAIFLIVALNAAVGFLQERKAERALSALRRLSAPSARVLREAVPRLLPAAELVPGDLVPIETGDRIPADGRIVWTARLRTAEAALTGESLPSEKSAQALEESRAPLAERSSMAYLGTTVADGRGLILVTATGLETELGRIAALLGETRRPSTPLEARLERLGRLLVGLFLGALSLIFVLGVARGRDIGEMLVVSLSLAVAAIPEGLPAVVTIALALGVQKMAQRRALVRRLASVETLGCATIICADKTGTLTRNEMNVRRVWACGREFEVTGVGYEPEGAFLERGRPVEARAAAGLEAVLRVGVLCNGAALYRRDGAWKTAGDPTEAALLAAGAKAGLWKEELQRRFAALEEIPFDPERKLMSVLRGDGGRRLLFVKGAPATVLQRCDRWLSAEGEVPLTDEARRAIAAAAEAMGAQALRVLAMAWRELPEGEALDERSESRLLLAGLAGMIDPARPEAAAAVAACRSAGIRPVMITGDQIATGLAVARETGLLGRGGRTLAGAELDAMSDEDLRRAVAGIDVYARASSQHKLRIVRAWKARGAVVAMTGDGINDAPALREADIGVAMGLSGTDVAREAADLVIADDNFATLVAAVEQGRGIYDSILKAVVFLISANVAELLAVSAPLLLGLTYADGSALLPLTAAQILWVNLVTDGLPALALAADPPAPGVMRRPPRGPDEPLLPPRLAWLMAGPALLASGAALAACLYAAPAGPRAAQSLTLTALVVSELLWSLLIRGAFGARLFTNPAIWAALGGSLALQAAILYLPPLSGIFGVEAPSAEGWILIAALVLLQACAGWALNRWVVIPNWNNRC